MRRKMEWLYFRTPRLGVDPDKQAMDFGKAGEFSPGADINFENHIERLARLNNSPLFKKMNGKRLRNLCNTEPFTYWRP